MPAVKPKEIKEGQGQLEESSEEKVSEPSEEKVKTGKSESFMDSLVNTFFGESSDSSDSSESIERDISDVRKELTDSFVETVVDEPPPAPEKKYLLELSLEKGSKEQPDYVVFNGRKGALLGENALRVNVGEKVRIFFGNIGPNGISSFHIIGEVFDRVYLEGAVNGIVNRNVQTTLVPSGGAAIVEFTIDVPGEYLLVDHSIFRIDKGAIGMITAVGDSRPQIFESIK